MNPFRADRAWRWPAFVHGIIHHLTGKVVVKTGWTFDDEDLGRGPTFCWADYERDVFWPAQERFLTQLRASESRIEAALPAERFRAQQEVGGR